MGTAVDDCKGNREDGEGEVDGSDDGDKRWRRRGLLFRWWVGDAEMATTMGKEATASTKGDDSGESPRGRSGWRSRRGRLRRGSWLWVVESGGVVGSRGWRSALETKTGFFPAARGKLAVPIVDEKRNRDRGRGSGGMVMEIRWHWGKVATELEEADVGFGGVRVGCGWRSLVAWRGRGAGRRRAGWDQWRLRLEATVTGGSAVVERRAKA